MPIRAILDPGRVATVGSRPCPSSHLASKPAPCPSSQSSLRFPLPRHLSSRIIKRNSPSLTVSVKAVLDSVRVDDIGSVIRNPSISTSYRNPNFPKPNQTVLDAQARVCTGPTQTRPLNEEQAFKVLKTILNSVPPGMG
ncbi:hypothetical protein M9H77_24392 [Catharanthus roseus]|uniref:Uncharacterized protein n=1 Tax=Catharanthus roseus TaxID=4058 RepID=A0ACC0AY67_CATRO|nr:hypothetical protein M9H77_24392 [Catharanthus roseus]